jgi:ppGpp synthetase/RelA/SpoT-type nucleotidyltranferase
MMTIAADGDDRDRAAAIGTAALGAFYGSRSADLEGDAEFLESHVKRLLTRSGYPSLKVEGRPKARDSAIQKLRRKCADNGSHYFRRILDGEPPQAVLTDLVGIRITCRFSDQIDEVATLIRANYLVRDADCVDHRQPVNYAAFGYAALHLVAEPVKATATQVYYSGCAFEIQIRSSLMDIWSVVNWDIAYTDERDIPQELLRRMSSISALFYLVDQEFTRIRDEVSEGSKRTAEEELGSAGVAVSFSDKLAVSLAKRGIAFDAAERKVLGEHFARASSYLAKDPSLGALATQDAVALFLSDRDRFAWVLGALAVKAIGEIERSGGLSAPA